MLVLFITFRNLDQLSGSTTVSLVSSSLLSTCWWSVATNLSNVPPILAVVTDDVLETAVCCKHVWGYHNDSILGMTVILRFYSGGSTVAKSGK